MSEPDVRTAFMDVGNPLLSMVTTRLDTGSLTEQGEAPKGILTFRSATTTFTAVLGVDDLDQWAAIISALAASLRGARHMPQRRVVPGTITDVMMLGKDGKGA